MALRYCTHEKTTAATTTTQHQKDNKSIIRNKYSNVTRKEIAYDIVLIYILPLFTKELNSKRNQHAFCPLVASVIDNGPWIRGN
jgi:hypothetical protein